ncbi:alpha-1,2-fucosyltransferase [Candidatus Saccharibacteria bacterium]|nr:alpha-1,2-fucosyltransferase [Candidatus Saccharibacteria bacterium]
MIGVKLMGGLGNQMFQYALGRKMAMKYKTKLVLDLNFYNNQAEIDTPRSYELDCYKISAKLFTKPLPTKQTLIDRLTGKPFFTNWYDEKHYHFDENVFKQSDGTLYNGFWQTYKYFESIRAELLSDFELKNTLNEADSRIEKLINQQLSASLHVRRGDYVTNKNANEHHGTKTVDYYSLALQSLQKDVVDFKLFVFSDDIEWCKANLSRIHPNILFVDDERPGYIDMHLMKQCSHNIIANSSFSWWAAWLNDNPDKIVIAPKQWFIDPNKNTSDVCPASWKLI